MVHQVRHKLRFVDGDENAASAFDDEIRIARQFWELDLFEADLCVREARGQMW